jgi:hypothetical protein
VAVKEAMDSGRGSESRPSIFKALLGPDEKVKGYVVPTVDQLKDEAYSILAAAADTTGNGMTVAAYNVVNDPAIYERLTKELEAEFPDADARLDFVTLEKLPYLVSFLWLNLICVLYNASLTSVSQRLSRKAFGSAHLYPYPDLNLINRSKVIIRRTRAAAARSAGWRCNIQRIFLTSGRKSIKTSSLKLTKWQ